MTWDRSTAPEPVDVTRAWIEHHLAGVHTAMPCRVQSYNASQQTADLVPLVRHPLPQPDGSFVMENLPVLPCVPVVFPRAAGHFLAFAVAPGDFALALFCEGAIGHWWAGANGGDVTDPGDLGRHHLSNAVCIPGLYPLAQQLTHAPSGDAAIVMGSDAGGMRITIKVNGTLEITQGVDLVAQCESGVWTFGGAAGAQFVALANLVDARLSSIRSWLNGHTHPTPSGASSPPTTALPAQDSVAATKAKAT